jgi:hypothetical protein
MLYIIEDTDNLPQGRPPGTDNLETDSQHQQQEHRYPK